MKRFALSAALLAIAFSTLPAAAQQPPAPGDDKLGVAMQLLNERTGQVIELAAEVQKISKKLQEAQAELTKLKAPPSEPKK